MDLHVLQQLTRTYENRTIDEFLTAWEDVKRAAPTGETVPAAPLPDLAATAGTPSTKPPSGKRKRRQLHDSRQRQG